MKLPENRTERIKVLSLIVIGIVGVTYALVVGIFSPLMNKKSQYLEALVTKSRDLETAQATISRASRNERANIARLKEILAVTERPHTILRPRLGNYLLEATEILEAHAQAAGIELDSINEIGSDVLPSSAGKDAGTAKALKGYTVSVRATGTMHNLITLLASLERSNPYLAIVKLDIVGNKATPESHTLSLDVQWPVWKDSSAPETIYSQVAASLTSKATDQPGGTNTEAQTTVAEPANKD